MWLSFTEPEQVIITIYFIWWFWRLFFYLNLIKTRPMLVSWQQLSGWHSQQLPMIFLQWSSHDQQLIILKSSYDQLIKIIPFSYNYLTVILWSISLRSYNHPVILLWASYNHLIIILQSSYDQLTKIFPFSYIYLTVILVFISLRSYNHLTSI